MTGGPLVGSHIGVVCVIRGSRSCCGHGPAGLAPVGALVRDLAGAVVTFASLWFTVRGAHGSWN